MDTLQSPSSQTVMPDLYTVMPCKKSWRAPANNGYIVINGKYLHRQLYEKHYDVYLTSKQVIRHRCNNRWCVEITHLALGTYADNIHDMKQMTGTYPWSKLSKEEVEEIRALYETTNMTQKQIGKKFGISQTMVHYIIARKWWK